MKKILHLWLMLFIGMGSVLPISHIQAAASDARKIAEENPVKLVERVKDESKIQNTELDKVTHRWGDFGDDYPITSTLDHARDNIWDYVQYIIYIWIAAATIFLIWNAFKVVTSQDREKQMGTFKRNLTYIIIGVILITWFYFILWLFSGMINLVFDF